MQGEFVTLDPHSIIVGERYRKSYPEIHDLVESIRTDGVIVPIQIDSKLNLIYGGRRLAASKIAELDEIPAIIRSDVGEVLKKKLELLENLHRVPYTPYEECKAKRDIDEEQKKIHGDQAITRDRSSWSLRKTAELLGESPGGVSQDIALADAMDHFPELQECKTKEDAKRTLKKIVEKGAEKVILQRATIQASSAFKYAKRHYNVGDAITGLGNMTSSGCALAEVDPPYAIGLTKQKKVEVNKDNIDTYNEWTGDEYVEKSVTVASELFRILPDNAWIVWWFGIEWYDMTHKILSGAGFKVDKIPCIWNKIDSVGQTQQPGMYLGRTYETFFIGRKGSPLMHKQGRSNVFSYQPIASQKKIHATEKPLALMEDIINTLLYPRSVAVIPFLGSGVTLRALYNNGMSGFGWDLGDEHKQRFLYQVAKDVEEGLYSKTFLTED